MFEINDLQGDYLELDSNFKITFANENKIILGPNGVGKSTIYKSIIAKHPDYEHIDYEELKNNFIKNKNKLYIGAQISELENKIREKQSIIDSINIKDSFKVFNVTSQATAKSIMDELKDAYTNFEKDIINFDDTNLEIIKNINNGDNQFFITNFKSLKEITNIESELSTLKDAYLKNVYDQLELILTDEDFECPICGTKKETSIKQIIKVQSSKLSTIKNELVKKYQKENKEQSPEMIISGLQNFVKSIKEHNITENNIINYYIAGGDIKKSQQILGEKKKIDKLNLEITSLEKKKISFYNSLKIIEKSIKNVFKTKFSVNETKILFNDQNKSVEITLPRNVDTYSTGEINLMVFTITINNFIASDKQILVVDDPLSSYDISNQYRIMFDLVDVTNMGKHIMILTHNIDCINIANTQYRGVFKYQYIEKINNKLYLNNVNIDENDSLMNIENLLKFCDTHTINGKYFELLIDREDFLNDPCNQIFHYDESYTITYKGESLSNEYLVSLIENFKEDTLVPNSFENSSILKILYMTALRVWIEKQFYLDTNGDTNLQNKLFTQKIDYMFPRNGANVWSGSSEIDRKYLMSKKTMINQHNHYKSQILPFNYAINISLDELTREILEIKQAFNSTTTIHS